MSVSIWAGYPRSYTPGRVRAPQFVTLHYTAGSEGPTSAENGVAYDKQRTDGTSCHYFTDSQGPALQEVPDGDRSHSALFHGNEIGIHIEICGTRQTRDQWLDPVSLATLRTTAALTREICDRHGFDRRRLTVAETRAAYYGKDHRPTGINDHYACTLAFPEDGGDHTDVGPEFPWDVFMDLVNSRGDSTMAFLARDTKNRVVIVTDDWNGWYRPPQKDAAQTETVLKDRAWWRSRNGLPEERWITPGNGIPSQFSFGDERTAGLFGPELAAPSDGVPGAPGEPVDYDEIRRIVDEELDEQSRAGADVDT